MNSAELQEILLGDGKNNIGLVAKVDMLLRAHTHQVNCIKSLWVAILSILTAITISYLGLKRF